MRWEGESWRPRIENSDVIMSDIISKFAVSLLTAFPSLLHLSQKLPRLQYALADEIYIKRMPRRSRRAPDPSFT